jgi:chromosome segregation ATPase
MDAELQQYLERLERKFDGLVSLFEQMEARNGERFAQLEARMTQLEARMTQQEARQDRLERRLDALEAQVREGFLGVNDRFQAMALAIEQFERRVQSSITAMQHDITKLKLQVDSLIERTDRLEDAVLHQTERLNGLGEDMRQRFRVVNERLAELAA